MNAIKIGGLGVTPLSYPKLYSYLQGIGEVYSLSPHEKAAKYDIIVVPPDLGITPNLNCFVANGRSYLPTKPISPLIERFRHEALEYYIENEIFILALGDAAALPWDKLGNKAYPSSMGLILLLDNATVVPEKLYGEEGDTVNGFRQGNLFGLVDIDHPGRHLAEMLATMKDEILSELSFDEPALVEKNPNKPAPVLTGKINPDTGETDCV